MGKGLRVAIDKEWGRICHQQSYLIVPWTVVVTGKGERNEFFSLHKRAIPRNSLLHWYQNIGNLSLCKMPKAITLIALILLAS